MDCIDLDLAVTMAITTEGLRSYGAAMKELGNVEKREVGRWANNRVENSHLPFRRRERAMTRFRRMHTLQRFSAVHASFHNPFATERHLTGRDQFNANRSAALAEWRTLALDHGRGGESCAWRRQVAVRLTARVREPSTLASQGEGGELASP